MILQRDLQGSKVLWPQMERACLPSGCALPSIFLTACKTFAKAGSTFFFPFLFCWIWFLIYLDLSLRINLEVSFHNLLERCMLGLLVSAFLSPLVQPCKAVESCGGRQAGNWEGMERYHLFLHWIHAWHLPALAMAPAHAGWSISTLRWAASTTVWWKIISVHKRLSKTALRPWWIQGWTSWLLLVEQGWSKASTGRCNGWEAAQPWWLLRHRDVLQHSGVRTEAGRGCSTSQGMLSPRNLVQP